MEGAVGDGRGSAKGEQENKKPVKNWEDETGFVDRGDIWFGRGKEVEGLMIIGNS